VGLPFRIPQPGLALLPQDPSIDKDKRFVEFETANDLKTAVEKLDQREFKGSRVTCVADVRSPFSFLFPFPDRRIHTRTPSHFFPDPEP
jgi:hypothetical protein